MASTRWLLLPLCLSACSPPPPPNDGGNDVVGADATMDAAGEDAIALDSSSDSSRYTFPDDVGAVGDPRSWSPRSRGPFRAGYRQMMVAYNPAGASEPRNILVHVWYPTYALTGPHPTYARIVPDDQSFRDAPPAMPAHGGRYPVHVYSHGDRGFAGTSHFLMRYFASHGWVSVAPDHTGNTISDVPREPRPYLYYHVRSRDVSAALDAVERLPAGDPLSGVLDTTHAVLSGHSFGTHTVWASVGATFDLAAIRAGCTAAVGCTDADVTALSMTLRDARFVAAIPMAGSIKRELFGATGHSSVTVPMLAMSGSDDPVGADGQFASTNPMPMSWIDIRGGCHQFFALGGCTGAPDADQEPILGAWALSFARRHALSDDNAEITSVLDGSLSVSDRVTLRRR